MKRLLSIFLSIVMLFSSLGAFSASASVIITLQYGDVNGSGVINNKDLGILMQYLNDWEVDGFYVSVADVNVDGSVNNKDYGLLMQYLNEWDVIIGTQSSNIAGKTIKFISTIDPANDESGPVVKNFEKEFGVKVEIISSGLDEHAQKCMGLIAAGNSPDVARSQGDFPAFMGYLQSLDAAKLDYTDPIWDQNMFKMTTFGGSPYLCSTVGNIWSDVDLVMYSKSLLKQANAYTPEEYDAMGKWTWDAFFEIGKACQKETGMPGCAINSYETFYHAAGGSVYKIVNGKVINGINSDSVSIMSKYAQARIDGILLTGKSVTSALMYGEIGITTLHAWSLKKTGDLRNAKWDDLGFYYLPYNDETSAATKERPCTGYLRGWGICRGANEPVAAGVFLREYLDVSNYDVSSTFITSAAENFFFELTNIDYNKYSPYLTYNNLNSSITEVNSNSEIYYPMYNDPAQIASSMASVKATVDNGVKNMNDFIEMYSKIS